MKHDNKEQHLSTHALHAHQQSLQMWGEDFADNVELITPAFPALAAMGLGDATAYLANHREYLAVALRHSDWSIRTAAVQVLSKQGERAPIDLLVHTLQDEHESVRAMAARGLGLQGKHTPLEPLIVALHDHTWRVRTAAVLALGRLEERVPVAELVSMLNDENESVRAAVISVLGKLGSRAPIEQLVTALQDHAWAVREAAAMALQEQGERAPIGVLLAARLDEDSSVRKAVDDALDYRFSGDNGQKLAAPGEGRLAPSWLRMILGMISVCLLAPLIAMLVNGPYYGRFEVVSKLVAIAVVCMAIAAINIIYQRKRFNAGSEQKPGVSNSNEVGVSWHGMVLAAVSAIILVFSASGVFSSDYSYSYIPGITPDVGHFVLIARLVALGLATITIVTINSTFHNTTFHKKR